MTDNIESLVIERLRAIGAKQSDQDEGLGRIESRITRLELTTSGMRRDLAHMYGEVIKQHGGYEWPAERLDRIERRLESHEE